MGMAKPDTKNRSESRKVKMTEERATCTHLMYAGMGWRNLPSNMMFPSLRVLDISRNRLTSLPQSLVRSTPLLEVLDFSHNRVAAFPRNIGGWKFLQCVHAQNNLITCFRESMVNLTSLVYMNMDQNPLQPALRSYFTNVGWDAIGCQQFARELILCVIQEDNAGKRSTETDSYYEEYGLPDFSLPEPTPSEVPQKSRILIKSTTRRAAGPVIVAQYPPNSLMPEYIGTPQSQLSQSVVSSQQSVQVEIPLPEAEVFRLERASAAAGAIRTVVSVPSMFKTNSLAVLPEPPDLTQEKVADGSGTEEAMPMEVTKSVSAFKKIVSLLAFVLIEIIKVGLISGCIFMLLICLASTLFDVGILKNMFALPSVNYWVPESIQSAFLAAIIWVATNVGFICVHFPIYRMQSHAWCVIIFSTIGFIAQASYGYLYDLAEALF